MSLTTDKYRSSVHQSRPGVVLVEAVVQVGCYKVAVGVCDQNGRTENCKKKLFVPLSKKDHFIFLFLLLLTVTSTPKLSFFFFR